MTSREKLTIESVEVRAVSVPLRRPIVAKIGTFPEWPFILIDVKTKEGIIGRSYLESYLKDAIRYIGPIILDLAEAFKGAPVAPLDLYQKAMGRLHLLGRQGLTLVALAGLDMAMWDIRAKAAGLPLAELLGGSIGPVRAYNTNGLWLGPLEKLKREAEDLVAEGGFSAIKIRLGRETLREDLEAIKLVRQAVGDDVNLMCDFNQGLKLDEALLRCHRARRAGTLLVRGTGGLRQFRAKRAAHTRTEDAGADWRKYLWAAVVLRSGASQRRRLLHAGLDAHRRCYRMDARGGDSRRLRAPDVQPSFSRNLGAFDARDRDGALARVEGLGQPNHR